LHAGYFGTLEASKNISFVESLSPMPKTSHNTSMANYRIIPVQQLCLLCGHELYARDGAHGLAGRLCRACIRLLQEQVFRELEQHPKIVRV
jgi:hypothetical protein